MIAEIWFDLFNSQVPGLVFSVLVPLLFLIFLVRDREAKAILGYFAWGIFSVILAYILNNRLRLAPNQAVRLSQDIAPIVEETLKALPLLFLARHLASSRNLILTSAMASGIGFSIQETLFYLNQLPQLTSLTDLVPILLRTVTTCLMHGMATAIIGYGLMMTIENRLLRIPMLSGLLAVAVTIHSIYNVLINTRLAIFALLMPAILYLIGLLLTQEPDKEEITCPPVNP